MKPIGSEVLKFNELDEPIFERTIDRNGTVQILKPQEKGLVKELTFKILFQRVALNPKTLQNISAWFVQDLLVKVPSKKEYEYFYLFHERGMSNVCLRILDVNMGRFAGFTTTVSLNDKTFVKKVNTPKRLTTEQAKKMLLNGEVLGVFAEDNLSEQHVQPKSE